MADIPVESRGRVYKTYLRGPAPTWAFAFAGVDDYRAGREYRGLLVSFPEPEDNAGDDFGIQSGGGFTVEIADEADDTDWLWLWEDGSRILWEDGSRIVTEY